jgi:hypothetical protein
MQSNYIISFNCFGLALATGLTPLLAQPLEAADGPKLYNVASVRYGARVTVDAPSNVVKDKTTNPTAYLDGNAHTRYVMTGAPYTINLRLPFKVAVEKISLAHSDYESEAAPKDIEVSFDGGAPIKQTLELMRPVKPARGRGRAKIAWQDIPVGREISQIKVTVLSNHEGKVKWGGLADLAVWTTSDIDARFKIEEHDPAAPVFIRPIVAKSNEATVKATLPPIAKAGEHPRLLFTPQEIKDLRVELDKNERGKTTFASFLKIAENGLATPIHFPSVADTVANKAGKPHQALSHRAAALGFAYALTGEEKYAQGARDILIGYSERYEDYPRHSGINRNDASKITHQRLSEAMWLIPLLEATDYIFLSKTLTANDKEQIENGLIRPAIEEIRRQTPATEVAARNKKTINWRDETPSPSAQGKYSNWLIFYNTATMMAGAILNDKDMMDLAAADLRIAIATGIGNDGMWGEGSISYQLFAMGALVPGLEVAARNGYDVWNSSNGRIKMLFDSPLRYAYPDGTLPGINDSGRGKFGSWQTIVYDYGYLRYGDPNYRTLLNDTQRQLHTSDSIYAPTRIYETFGNASVTKTNSTLFENLGYSILRDDNKYALLDYGPHGGTHGHYDKLNLLLFASANGDVGDEIGGEPKFHFYDNPLHPTWTIQTIAHNTMTVDEGSQIASDGKLLVFEDTPDLKIMRGESVGSYPGVLLDRTVLVTPDAVIDLFTGRSSLDHTWDRTFRYNGKLAGLPIVADAKPLGLENGYQNFKVAKQESAANGWSGIWDTKAGKFKVAIAGTDGQNMVLGTGPNDDQIALARQSGKNAKFAATYALQEWNNPVQSVNWLPTDKNVSSAEIKQQDGTITTVMVGNLAGTWQSGNWKSDARVLVVREKGADSRVVISGGTFATNGEAELRQNSAGNYSAQKRGNKFELISQWTPAKG